ncbi:MAG: protease modulator HflC [Chloroflexi bacterium]|nr:protease modulator HflC [Chloroflexota bacterium]MDA1219749.1 protease modulator HflC [Chloroflexota bacterium]PKB57184.1 MAG: HflC protein [SAR202 cluster bacterium Casp-Chloro-G3]
MKALVVLLVLAIIGLIVLRQATYIVDETEQVIITRFGEVKNVTTEPGLNFKAPFVDLAITLDKRILRIDATPVAMPDREKQNLVIDSYARYRIVDPVQFRKTLLTETNARSRLGDIVTSTLRDRVALRNRFEIIGAEPILDDLGNPIEDDEGLPLFEGRTTRNEILAEVLEGVRRRVAQQNFGIEIIDVRMKRADFPDSVTASIYDRMRAERNRIATRFRAEGDEEDLKIRAVANRDREIILAQADRQSNQIRGEGEAESIKILADALNQDPEFFAFQRSLEAYQTVLGRQDTLILSGDTPLFDFLGGPGVPDDAVQPASPAEPSTEAP